jgi:hypothetical protein
MMQTHMRLRSLSDALHMLVTAAIVAAAATVQHSKAWPHHISSSALQRKEAGLLKARYYPSRGVLLHVDMFAHNKSGIAYRNRNRRPETVVDNKISKSTPPAAEAAKSCTS